MGLNPLPGYKLVNQTVSAILMDPVGGKLYILDATTGLIGVYDADTLIRLRDIDLDNVPLSMAFNGDRSGILLGYSTGRVYLLDLATDTAVLKGDVLIQAKHMAAFGDTYVLVADGAYSTNLVKSLNLANGQIVDTHSNIYDSPSALEWNEADFTVYYHDYGTSPADLFRVRLNDATGEIVSIADSIYHGTYSLGTPIRIINNGTRVITSSGNMFTCSTVDSSDLNYAANIGYSYIDLISDDSAGYLYALNNQTIRKLLITNQSDFFLKSTIDLSGNPKRVFYTTSSILVFVESEGKYYAKVWDKADLGL